MGGFLLGFTMGSTVHKELRGLLWDYGFESATPINSSILVLDLMGLFYEFALMGWWV